MRPKNISRREYNALAARAEALHKNDPDCRRKENVDFLLYLVCVMAVLLSIRMFLGEPVQVLGPSMYPTLEPNERMIVEKVSYWFDAPRRGDIIICYYPGYTKSCVKRVIGLPGDQVQVINGLMCVNGVPLDESRYWNDWIDEDTDLVTVPGRSLFVVGDNRNVSEDSRSHWVGCIPYKKVEGRVIGVMWPLGNARSIPRETY